ncbi:MAG TPA: hypothetical protein VF092_21550 [Longimicrobium sp.]
MFGELRSALTALQRLGARAGPEDRDQLRAALAAARELVRTAQLRTRAEWAARGNLQRGALYLELADKENMDAAEKLLRKR